MTIADQWLFTSNANDSVGALNGSVASGTPAYGAAGVASASGTLEIDFGTYSLVWQNLSYPALAANILFPFPSGFSIGCVKIQIQIDGSNLSAFGYQNDRGMLIGPSVALSGITAGWHRIFLALNDSSLVQLWIDGVSAASGTGAYGGTPGNSSTTFELLGPSPGSGGVKGMTLYSAGTDSFGQSGSADVAADYAAFPNPAASGPSPALLRRIRERGAFAA